MKYFYIAMVLVAIITLGSFSAIYATVQNNNSKTIYVSKNGTDRNDGLTPQRAKKNIETALNSADPGDIVVVGPGIYQINLNIVKNISLIGSNQDTTIIQGERLGDGSPSCVRVQPGVNATITGFTIKKGNPGQYSEWGPHGGGIYNKGILTLKDSTVTDNNGNYGGGIENSGTLKMDKVTIKNNIAKSYGGGIYSEGPLLVEDSIIINNTVTTFNGGGIDSKADAIVRRSTIKNNHANAGWGGGIRSHNMLVVEDSVFYDNTAGCGGGISPAVLYLYNSTLFHNRAAERGGGVYTPICELCRSYVDNLSLGLIHDNFPNNFGGKPYTPA